MTRVFLFGFGFNWVRKRGELAATKDAPILVVSPHSCFLDIFVISMYSKYPTFLARSSVKRVPIFGRTLNPLRMYSKNVHVPIHNTIEVPRGYRRPK